MNYVRNNQFSSCLLGYLLSIPIAFVFIYLVIISDFWFVFGLIMLGVVALLYDLIAKE